MNSKISFDKLSYKNTSLSNICISHKENNISYCKSCSLDICNQCLSSHFNHDLINYEKIQPKKEEIELLKNTIKKYEEDYNKLLSEIFSWKKILEKIITSFQYEISYNKRINDNINFIFNITDYNNMNYYSIFKFRHIFNGVIEQKNNLNNNQILNYMNKYCNFNNNFYNENKMGLFEYNNYNKLKLCLDKIINNQNNENQFLYKSNCLINIIWENYISTINNNEIYNKKKTIIEKYIDLSQYKKNAKNKFKFNINKEKIDLNKTQPSFRPKIGNIFLDQNYLNTSPNNEINSNFDNNINNNINFNPTVYFKKRRNSDNNIFYNNKNRKNISFNINEYNTNLNINKINLFLKQEKISNINKTDSIDKIIQKNKNHKNNDNQGKTFVHKKFEAINLKQFIKNSSKKESNVQNNDVNDVNLSQKTYKYSSKSEKNKMNDKNGCYFLNISDNKLNSTYNSSENIKQKLNFESCSNETIIKNNDMTLLINNDMIKENEIIYKLPSNNINNPNINISILNTPEFKKTIKENKFKNILASNSTLYIGLELGNINCKLGIINENKKDSENKVLLFPFKDNILSFPFILSFNEEKGFIEIGHEAYNSFVNNNNSKTIFNILNFLGKNSDEITFNEELYNCKIISNENKPYIKVNYRFKEKLFNFEDLFTIYIKKVFEKFFEKIEIINNEKNNIIQIILNLSIPDNINYYQRKIIEKIFQSQIFPSVNDSGNYSNSDNNSKKCSKSKLNSSSNNSDKSKNYYNKKLYSGYQIILKDIKIENSSSIIHLSYKLKENKINNILALISNGEEINISLATVYKDNINNKIKDIYEIKNVINIQKSEVNLINDFIREKIKLKRNEINVNNLRKICYEYIFNIDNNNINDKIELNEFNKSLDNIYKEIISSIKIILQKEKLNENNINHILIEGKIFQTKIFLELLTYLFKDNKEININTIKANISNNNIIIGTTIHSYNLNSQKLKNISPISFGIDSFGLMEFLIKKGDKIPIIKNKKVKIKNEKNKNYSEINIYEGENKEVKNNRIISCIEIDKKNFKNEKIYDDYIELVIQFELDIYCNLRVFLLDHKTLKKRIECLINIDVIKE